nr:protein argonaute 16 [Quercus suber]
MIEALYKPLEDGNDNGIIRELLLDFYQISNRKPTQIIVFRDGLDQIRRAYQNQWEDINPMFTVIVAQKNHHTKLFQADSLDKVPPGTVVDTKTVHPRNYNFYMCAHAGMVICHKVHFVTSRIEDM